jgi:hypothetical protein
MAEIQLDPWIEDLIEKYEKKSISPPFLPSLTLRAIATFSNLTRTARRRRLEIQIAYAQLMADISKVRMAMSNLSLKTSTIKKKSSKQHCDFARVNVDLHVAYGLLLAFSMHFNRILCAFHPADHQLKSDSDDLFNHLVELAAGVLQMQPLGASFMPMILMVGWATAGNDSKRIQVEGIMVHFEADFEMKRWMDGWLRDLFDNLTNSTEAFSEEVILQHRTITKLDSSYWEPVSSWRFRTKPDENLSNFAIGVLDGIPVSFPMPQCYLNAG